MRIQPRVPTWWTTRLFFHSVWPLEITLDLQKGTQLVVLYRSSTVAGREVEQISFLSSVCCFSTEFKAMASLSLCERMCDCGCEHLYTHGPPPPSPHRLLGLVLLLRLITVEPCNELYCNMYDDREICLFNCSLFSRKGFFFPPFVLVFVSKRCTHVTCAISSVEAI